MLIELITYLLVSIKKKTPQGLYFNNLVTHLKLINLLLGLASFDTIFLLLMASTKGIPAIFLNYESLNIFDANMGHITAPILSIIYTASILFGVSLSFERFMFFSHLHLHSTIFTYWKIIFWIITLIMFSIIVNIPIFLNFDYARWFYLLRFLIAMLFFIGFESMTHKEVTFDLLIAYHANNFSLSCSSHGFTNSQSRILDF